MFKRGLLSAVAAVAMTFGVAGAGHAGVVTWTISNGVFDDGGTLSGTFSIDTNDAEIVNYDVVSTPGSAGTGLAAPGPAQFGIEYSTSNPDMWAYTAGPGFPVLSAAVLGVITEQLDLTSVPFPGSGTYSLAGGTEGLMIEGPYLDPTTGEWPHRTLISGVAVSGAVPEPATWAMLILGLGLIGCAARRRNAGVAVAA